MFGGFLKSVANGRPAPLAKLDATELRNVLEQERLTADALKVHLMLATTLQGTKKQLAEKYSLPGLFELDRETGEIFKKESSDG